MDLTIREEESMVSDHAVEKGRSKSTTRRLPAEGSTRIEDIQSQRGVATSNEDTLHMLAAAQLSADNSSAEALPSTAVVASAVLANSRQAEGRSWLLRFLETFMEAERRVAIRRLHWHLRTLSDHRLTEWGFNEEDIATLRAGGDVDLPDFGMK